MTPSFLHALRRLPAFAAAALSTLCAASARADIVPHVQLTPYQIVTSNNVCLQGNMNGVLEKAACDPTNNLQKFYVLNEASDTDVVFQTLYPGNGERVRIALASTFDTAPTAIGEYNLFTINGDMVSIGMSSTPVGSPAAKTWIMTRNPWGPVIAINRLFAANENSLFRVAGVRAVSYGANGQFIEKVVNAFDLTDNVVPCTNGFFGGDPAYGVAKACYINSILGAQTKYQVRLAVYGRANDCIAAPVSLAGVVTMPCQQLNQSELTFTFRPTSYPQ